MVGTPHASGKLAHARLPTARFGDDYMGMVTAPTKWTVAMVQALPDDSNRYEIIDGELFVTPAPTWNHQGALAVLFHVVYTYVRANAIGHALFAPADIEFSEQTLVQPDLFVTPRVGGRKPERWEEVRSLLLAVEVLSPSSARADRRVKRRLYQRFFVPEYWVVDVDARLVERWRPEDERPEILVDILEWQPESGCAPLSIDLADYFAEVLGE